MNNTFPYPRWNVPLAGAFTVLVFLLAIKSLGTYTVMIAASVIVALFLAPFARTWYLSIMCLGWAAIDWCRVGSIAGDQELAALVWVALGFALGGDLMAVSFGITDEEVWGAFRRRRKLEKRAAG
jgi:hypothetical protein